MKVTIFGLGNMGYPMAQRIASVHKTWVYDLDNDLIKKACESFATIALNDYANLNQMDAIVLCLPNPDISKKTVQLIHSYLSSNTVLIETSTVNPSDIFQLQDILDEIKVSVIDASILAGVSQMKNGTASLALGGGADIIQKIKPVLDAITSKQIHFGDLGAGAAAKVINNAVAHAIMVVVAEAGSMAKAAGVNSDALIKILSDPEMGLHRPLTYRYAERIKNNNFDGGMPLDAAKKDSVLAIALAQQLEVPIFAIQASHNVYEIASRLGHGRLDYAAIAKVWELIGKSVI